MSTGSRQEQRCRDRAETREMHDGSKDIRQAMGRVPHALLNIALIAHRN